MTIHQSQMQSKANQTPLIPVSQSQIGDGLVQTVNARELHAFLEVGKVFAAWIQERIEQFGFVENQDFIVISETGKNPKGGRPSKEYFLALDMAKELSMVERNQKGKEARQYFIQCERVAQRKPADPMVALNDPATMRGILLTYTEKVLVLESKVEEMRPDVEALERIAKADGSMCITNAAKHLQVQPKCLFRLLSENQWIYKRAGGKSWIAYQDKIQSGLLEHKVTTVSRSDGSEKVVEQVLVTAKGIAKISKMLCVSGVAA